MDGGWWRKGRSMPLITVWSSIFMWKAFKFWKSAAQNQHRSDSNATTKQGENQDPRHTITINFLALDCIHWLTETTVLTWNTIQFVSVRATTPAGTPPLRNKQQDPHAHRTASPGRKSIHKQVQVVLTLTLTLVLVIKQHQHGTKRTSVGGCPGRRATAGSTSRLDALSWCKYHYC